METLSIFGYLIAIITFIAFLYLIFRSKADIDYLQEYSLKLQKIINSSTRIMFFILNAYVLWYITYQVTHPPATIDLVLVTTLLGVAWGGKAGMDAIKKDKPNGNGTTP